MSRTIDEKVVSMQFDNQKFENNVKTSMNTIDKLKRALNLDGASKGLESVNTAARRFDISPLSNGVEAVRTKFSALEVMGITALANITNSAVNAGKRIASALTIDPIKSGFQEYETQINAVQTILANTSSKGTDLKQVNDALDTLNTYADKTIYNFTEMTRNIGTFTAAGIDLDTSVNAIQGIANLAAVSGSNSQQASTAMYQLSQALASGTVKLMDWNSVVNAGMGGQVFQDALKETSKELGTGAEAAIKANGSFRDSLTTGWLTSKVLTETLKKFTTSGANEYVAKYTGLSAESVQAALEAAEAQYGEAEAVDKAAEALAKKSGKNKQEIKEALQFAKTAEDAATKVKTLTQLWDTLKEAAQSGWTQSWEIIVGDFDEAKSLFTEISDTIGTMIGESAEARNKVLQGWKDLGGRDDLLDGLRNAFKGVLSIIKPIKEAFREIFPPVTAKQLAKLTESFKNLTSHLKMSDEQAARIKETFKGVFAAIDIVVTVIKEVAGGAFELIGSLTGLGGGFLEVTASIGTFVTKLRNSIKDTDIFGKTIDKIVGFLKIGIDKIKAFGSAIKDSFKGPTLSGFTGFMTSLGNFATAVSGKIIECLSNVGSSIAKAFGETNFLDALNSGLLGGIMIYVIKFVKGLKNGLEEGVGVLENVKGILDDVRGCFQAYQENLKAGTLLKIAAAIGILAAAIFVIASVDPNALGQALGAITVLFGELLGSLAIFNKLGVDLKGVTKTVIMMIGMSIAILLLAGAMKRMAELDWEGLGKGLVGVTAIVGILIGAAKLMDGNSKSITKFAGQMVILSIAIGSLSLIAKLLSTMSWEEIAKGGAGIIGLTTILVGAAKIMDTNSKSITKFAGQMLLMSIAIGALAVIGKLISTMSWKEMGKGGAAILGLTTMLVAAAKIMDSGSKSITKFGFQLILMATALAILTPVLKSLGGMSWEEIAKGLVAIGGALAELTIALNLMNGTLAGSAALIIAAAALAIITPVLKTLGGMSWEEIAKGLVALAGAFTVIGIAGMLLAPVIPAIIGLGAAFALLGVGMIGIGAGLTLIGIGLTSIAAAGAVAATSLVASVTIIVTGLLDLIPNIAGKIGEAIVAIAKVIGDCAPQLAEAFMKLVSSVLESMVEYVPQMVDSLVSLWVGILSSLTERMPELINSLFDFLIAILNGLSDRMPELIQAGANLFGSILTGIAEALGPLVDLVIGPLAESIGNALSKIADSMAPIVESVSQAIQSICDAFIELVQQISPIIDSITGLVEQLGDSISQVFNSVANIISTCGDTIAQVLESIATTIDSVFNGIAEVITSVGDSIRTVLDGISGIIDSIGDAALNAGTGFDKLANGVKKITELNLIDMVASLSAVAAGVSKIASSSDGIAETGNGMQQIATGAAVSAVAFTTMAYGISSALYGLSLIGPAMTSAASSINNAATTLGVGFVAAFSRMIKSAITIVTGSIGAFASAGRALAGGLQNGIKVGIVTIVPLVMMIMKASVVAIKATQQLFYASGLALMAKLAQGIRAGNANVTSAISAALSEGTTRVKTYYTPFYSAGSYLAKGFALGINSSAWRAKVEAEAMANAAVQAAKEALGIQSPSRIFAQIGEYVDIGLANGIRENVAPAVNASAALGTSILKGIQDRLGIHSPSVVFNKEVGRYIVQGIAEGITKDTSAEDAITKKAQNIVTAFKKELDKLSLDMTTLDLENQLWSLTDGAKASDEVTRNQEIAKTTDEIAIQEKKVKLADDEYQQTLNTFGETAEQTQEAYNKLLQSRIDLANMNKSLSELQEESITAGKSALDAYNNYLIENRENLLKWGYSMDTIDEWARLESGYTGPGWEEVSYEPKVTKTSGELIKGLVDKVESKATKIGEVILNAIKPSTKEVKDAGSNIAIGLSNGLSETATTVKNAATKMASTAISTVKKLLGINSPSKVFYGLGSYAGQGLVNALGDYVNKTYDAGYNVANSAKDGLSDGLSKVKDMIKMGVDNNPTITPVVDMSNVQARNVKFGSSIDVSLSKPIDSLSQIMANTQAEINASNNKVVDAVDGLRQDMAAFCENFEKETALYVDAKKLASSIAKPMNRQLNILSKRGAY